MAIRRIIRRPEVKRLTGQSDSTIDRLEKANRFPKRVQLSSNSVGWYENEIAEHIENLPRGSVEPPAKANTARRESGAKFRKDAAA